MIEVERRWAHSTVKWGVLSVALLGLLAGLAGAAHALQLARQNRLLVEKEWSPLQAHNAKKDTADAAADEANGDSHNNPTRDFTKDLPQNASLPDLVQRIQREASPLNVQLQSLLAKAGQGPGAQLLGRSELGLNLRGTYPAIRQLLVSTLAHHPHVTLPMLRIRRVEGSGDVEAQATLTVWTRPVEGPAVHEPLTAPAAASVAGAP